MNAHNLTTLERRETEKKIEIIVIKNSIILKYSEHSIKGLS